MGKSHIIHRKQQMVDLFNEQGGRCYYCGCEMTLRLGKKNTATRDHVIPKSKGGPTELWNLVAACQQDNAAKGDMPLEQFLKIKGGENGPSHRVQAKKTSASNRVASGMPEMRLPRANGVF